MASHRATESITHHVYFVPPAGKAPLLVMHHGAGSSGLSFALFSSEIRKALPNCGLLSVDARGHGETTVSSLEASSSDDGPHLSLEVLSQDLAEVIGLTKTEMGWVEMPDIVLIGHSLGGAVVVDLAVSGRLGKSVLGCAVLDVVEGSAMDALQSMQQYLATRPTSFPSLDSAIEWQYVRLSLGLLSYTNFGEQHTYPYYTLHNVRTDLGPVSYETCSCIIRRKG